MAAAESIPPALEVRDLKKTYSKKGQPVVEALKGVSLSIPKGEFFALLGPNGAGKTTLIATLAGLVQKTSGSVEVNGISVDADPDTTKGFIGLVPQEMNFSIFEKVEDIILDQAGYYGIKREDARPVCDQLLKDLGLWEKRTTKAQALSGGMKRRLMIARALIHKPSILLLDEPTAGVDVELRRGMWEFLQNLSASGVTIILTTHYLEEAERLAKRVAIINKGVVVEQGTVKELLTKLNYVTLTVDTKEPVKDAALLLLEDMQIKRIDDTTLEFNISPGQTVNEAMRTFAANGIEVVNIRNAGSRLEEIFVNIIEKHS